MRFGVLLSGVPTPFPLGFARLPRAKGASELQISKNIAKNRREQLSSIVQCLLALPEQLRQLFYTGGNRTTSKAEGNGSIRECRMLVRQSKVGGGQAPDQPERPDRRTEQRAHQSIFCKLLICRTAKAELAENRAEGPRCARRQTESLPHMTQATMEVPFPIEYLDHDATRQPPKQNERVRLANVSRVSASSARGTTRLS